MWQSVFSSFCPACRQNSSAISSRHPSLKPCLLTLFLLDGWYVLFIVTCFYYIFLNWDRKGNIFFQFQNPIALFLLKSQRHIDYTFCLKNDSEKKSLYHRWQPCLEMSLIHLTDLRLWGTEFHFLFCFFLLFEYFLKSAWQNQERL